MAKQTHKYPGFNYEEFDEAISEAEILQEITSQEIGEAEARLVAARSLLEFSSTDETIMAAARDQLDAASHGLTDARRHLESTKGEVSSALKAFVGVTHVEAAAEIKLPESA